MKKKKLSKIEARLKSEYKTSDSLAELKMNEKAMRVGTRSQSKLNTNIPDESQWEEYVKIIKVRPYYLNKKKTINRLQNLERYDESFSRESGRQIYLKLNTATYEILKINLLDIIKMAPMEVKYRSEATDQDMTSHIEQVYI